MFAFISGSTEAWIGLGAADSTTLSSDVFRFLRNAKPINPDRTRKAPATINQCGYSMAESISYFPFTFSQPDQPSAILHFRKGDGIIRLSLIWLAIVASRFAIHRSQRVLSRVHGKARRG